MPEDDFVMVKLANGSHKRLPADHPGVTAEGVTKLKRAATRDNGDAEPDKTATDLGTKSSATSAASTTSETGTASANQKGA